MNGKYYGRLEIRYHKKEAERLAHIYQKKERFKKMSVKGYKVFNPDWTCRNFQYQVGQTYEMEGPVIPCERGFHFCKNAADCFNHYAFNPENKVAEVIAHLKKLQRELNGIKPDKITLFCEDEDFRLCLYG